MGACLSDMAEHGIDLADAHGAALRRLVRLHLEYFQLMLGYDAAPTEIAELVDHVREARAVPA
jgi:hypothetical protein